MLKSSLIQYWEFFNYLAGYHWVYINNYIFTLQLQWNGGTTEARYFMNPNPFIPFTYPILYKAHSLDNVFPPKPSE